MAVTQVRKSADTAASSANPVNISFDGTGCDYIQVYAAFLGFAGVTVSATYDGVSMAVAGSSILDVSARLTAKIFGIVAPPTGTKTASITFSAGGNAGLVKVIGYSGVDQTTPTGTALTYGGSTASDTLTITDAVANDLVVDCFIVDTGSSFSTGNQTEDQADDYNDAGYYAGVQHAAGAGSVAMQWSVSTSMSMSHCAVALLQAASGTNVALSGSAGTSGIGTSPPGISIGL